MDILAVAQVKLDSSFPSAQFLVHGYKTSYRKDGNKHGGGLLVYVKEDIPCCQLTNHPPVHNLLDIIAIELNFWKHTWLLIVVYKSPSVSDTALFEQMSNVINFYYRNIKILFWLVILTLSLLIKSLMHSVRAMSFKTLLRVRRASNQVVVHV